MTTKPTALMRRILADIHNAAGGMLPRSHFTGPGTGAVTALLSRKLLADDGLDPAGARAMLRLTDAGRAALGLRPNAMSPGLAPSPIVKTDPPKPVTGGLVQSPLRTTPAKAPAREARSSRVEFMTEAMEKGANLGEAMRAADEAGLPRIGRRSDSLLTRMAEKIERAVALRKALTAEDWLELFSLAHEARELVRERQAPLRDDDPSHPQE